MARLAIYARVSTGAQTVDNQVRELTAWAERAGHTVERLFSDHAISGSKGRAQRPAFDAMLKAAVRREFDVLAVWSSDRLGRSLQHLLEVLQTIRDTGTGLYIHTQALDTTTPAGRAMFGMLGVFAEFEREIIVERVNAGIARARETGTKSGKPIGRPTLSAELENEVRGYLGQGRGILATARALGVGTGTVQRIKRSLAQ